MHPQVLFRFSFESHAAYGIANPRLIALSRPKKSLQFLVKKITIPVIGLQYKINPLMGLHFYSLAASIIFPEASLYNVSDLGYSFLS